MHPEFWITKPFKKIKHFPKKVTYNLLHDFKNQKTVTDHLIRHNLQKNCDSWIEIGL